MWRWSFPANSISAAEAFLRGIERRIDAGLKPDASSVASLSVSRWDAAVAGKVPDSLGNRLGVLARRTYQAYRNLLTSPRCSVSTTWVSRRSLCCGQAPARALKDWARRRSGVAPGRIRVAVWKKVSAAWWRSAPWSWSTPSELRPALIENQFSEQLFGQRLGAEIIQVCLLRTNRWPDSDDPIGDGERSDVRLAIDLNTNLGRRHPYPIQAAALPCKEKTTPPVSNSDRHLE
jgi:hypothetical protein